MFPDRAYFFDEGLRFECQGCGACCTGDPGTVYVGPDEINRIAGYLGLDAAAFKETYLYAYKDSFSIREDHHGNCLFFHHQCAIYPVRPLQCSTFPFWFSNLRSQAGWDALQHQCPGIGQGRLYSKQEIIALACKTLMI